MGSISTRRKKKKAPTVIANGLTQQAAATRMNPELGVQHGPMNWMYDVREVWECDEYDMDKLTAKMDGTQDLRFARWICKQLCCAKQSEKALYVDQGVVDSMVHVLRKFGCEDRLVALYACAAIGLFCKDDDLVRARLQQLGVVEAVIAVLDSFAATTAEWFVCFEACIALYALQPHHNNAYLAAMAKVVASFAEESVERGKLGVLACTMLYTLHRANPSSRINDYDNSAVVMGIESIANNDSKGLPMQWNSDTKAQFQACTSELISWLNKEN